MFGLDDIIGSGLKLLDRVIPDPAAKQAAQLELMKLAQSGDLAQMTAQTDVNKAEATNPNMFVAGWRPFVGWCCGAAFGWNYVLGPIGMWLAALFGHPTPVPVLDMSLMMPVMMGMLGLGAYRTYEKVNDAAGNH